MSAADVQKAVSSARTSDDLVVTLAMLQSARWRTVAVELRRRGGSGYEAIAEEFEAAAQTVQDLCGLIRPGSAR